MDKAKRIGLAAYEAELNKKVEALEELLRSYDDGRRKSFFCTAVNLLDLHDVNAIMGRLAHACAPDAPRKEKAAAAARLFEELADKTGISLKLRKK